MADLQESLNLPVILGSIYAKHEFKSDPKKRIITEEETWWVHLDFPLEDPRRAPESYIMSSEQVIDFVEVLEMALDEMRWLDGQRFVGNYAEFDAKLSDKDKVRIYREFDKVWLIVEAYNHSIHLDYKSIGRFTESEVVQMIEELKTVDEKAGRMLERLRNRKSDFNF